MGEKQERFPSKAPQEELIPGKTQNLSSATHRPGDDVTFAIDVKIFRAPAIDIVQSARGLDAPVAT